jgi:hypothetical protein
MLRLTYSLVLLAAFATAAPAELNEQQNLDIRNVFKRQYLCGTTYCYSSQVCCGYTCCAVGCDLSGIFCSNNPSVSTAHRRLPFEAEFPHKALQIDADSLREHLLWSGIVLWIFWHMCLFYTCNTYSLCPLKCTYCPNQCSMAWDNQIDNRPYLVMLQLSNDLW